MSHIVTDHIVTKWLEMTKWEDRRVYNDESISG